MAGPKIFIITPEGRAERFCDRVLREVVPQYRDSIIILKDEAFKSTDVILAAKNMSDRIDDLSDNQDSHLLIVRETKASHSKLKNRWIDAGRESGHVYVAEDQRVAQKFDKIIKHLEFQWQAYAEKQLQKFDGVTTPLAQWCQQFSRLAVGYLGRRLAMQLQVVSFGDHNRPFAPKVQDSLGQKVLHCYFNDGDHGGSWISVQEQLSHAVAENSVHAIVVTASSVTLPNSDADEIIIYEDGLWSGSETTKRIRQLSEAGINRTVRLKFLVVTDFGIMVARHALRHYNLQNIIKIDASEANWSAFSIRLFRPSCKSAADMSRRLTLRRFISTWNLGLFVRLLIGRRA